MTPARKLKQPGAAPGRPEHLRFPVSVSLEYVTKNVRGLGTALAISGRDVFIRTGQMLPAGHRVELFIDWPSILEGWSPWHLIVNGKILRSTENGAAIRISRYKFRLRFRVSAA